jgi:DNA-binding response OmpR family regulator
MEKRTILVVDDESHITYMLAYKLRQADFNVLTASDGEEAYQLACDRHPDLVVTDYQMPVLSGYDMSVRLREDPRTAQVPVLMLTARGHLLSPTELGKTNIQFMMPKPFSARELMVKVREMLGSASEDDTARNHQAGAEAQPS